MKTVEGELGKHAKTLVGPRTRGSTTEFGLDLLPKHRELTKTNHPCVAKGCECYSVFAPELKGRCGALSFRRARAFGPVKVREGAHGLELYLDTKDFVKQAADETFVYFIVGDFDTAPTLKEAFEIAEDCNSPTGYDNAEDEISIYDSMARCGGNTKWTRQNGKWIVIGQRIA